MAVGDQDWYITVLAATMMVVFIAIPDATTLHEFHETYEKIITRKTKRIDELNRAFDRVESITYKPIE